MSATLLPMSEVTPRVTVPISTPSIKQQRISAAFLALLMGYFFVVQPIRGVWDQHWLVKDGIPGMAVVTKWHWGGHNVIVYQYRVGQQVFTGQSRRSLENPKYAHVMPGEKTIVYFSSSHPWISAIDLPHIVAIPGLPVVLLAWFFLACSFITAINPKHRWAVNLSGQRRPAVARAPQPQGRNMAKDTILLLVSAMLVVVAIAAIAIGTNALFGRR